MGRQWNSQRIGHRQVHWKGEQDHDHQRQGPLVQGGHREDGERGGEVQGGGREAAREDQRQERTRVLLLQHEVHHGRGEAEGGRAGLQPHHSEPLPGSRRWSPRWYARWRHAWRWYARWAWSSPSVQWWLWTNY